MSGPDGFEPYEPRMTRAEAGWHNALGMGVSIVGCSGHRRLKLGDQAWQRIGSPRRVRYLDNRTTGELAIEGTGDGPATYAAVPTFAAAQVFLPILLCRKFDLRWPAIRGRYPATVVGGRIIVALRVPAGMPPADS